jgi:hypothetical protein
VSKNLLTTYWWLAAAGSGERESGFDASSSGEQITKCANNQIADLAKIRFIFNKCCVIYNIQELFIQINQEVYYSNHKSLGIPLVSFLPTTTASQPGVACNAGGEEKGERKGEQIYGTPKPQHLLLDMIRPMQ